VRYDTTEQFDRDYDRLSADERTQFKAAVKKFIEDLRRLPHGRFRPSLRVKPMQAADGTFEMTWAHPDGRATFEYGDDHRPGDDAHIVWRRVGGHVIFDQP
jgi:hypothetical protein